MASLSSCSNFYSTSILALVFSILVLYVYQPFSQIPTAMTAQDFTPEQISDSFMRALKANPPSDAIGEPASVVTGPGADKVRVKILTQNMIIRPPGIKNNKSDYKDERLDYLIAEILKDYDVVCLQEMFDFGSSRRDTLLNAAKKLGFEYHVASPKKHIWNLQIDGGLVILSRFPIVEQDQIRYKRGMMSDWLASKGVLYAKIAVPSAKDIIEGAQQQQQKVVEAESHLHIFTTHTQASYGALAEMTQPDVKHRLLQLHQFHNFLEEIIPKHRKDGEPVILCGDFNVDSRTHHLSGEVGYERDREDGIETSVEAKAMVDILRGHGIDPNILGPKNKDAFKGSKIYDFEDMLYERYGYHPVTFGNIYVDEEGKAHPRETVITSSDNMVMHSIDYVFMYNPGQHKSVKATMEDLAVVPNFISGKPFTQISDHYGVGTIVTFETEKADSATHPAQ